MGQLSPAPPSFPIVSDAPGSGSGGFSTHEGHSRVDRCLSGRRGWQAGAESEVERGQQATRDSRDDGTSRRALGRSFEAGRKEGQPDPESREDAL